MKRIDILGVFCIILFAALSLPSVAQNAPDNTQQQRPSSPSRQGRPGMMGFRSSPLEGVWQACNVKEEGGQVRMQLTPCLKMVGSNGMYQDITVNTSAEGSIVTENGFYMQLNDSTFRREITACSDTVAAKKYDKKITVEVQGSKWLVIAYTSVDGKETFQEIWKRISTSAPISMRSGFSRGSWNRGTPSGGNNMQRPRRNSGSNNGNAFQKEMNNAIKEMCDDSF